MIFDLASAVWSHLSGSWLLTLSVRQSVNLQFFISGDSFYAGLFGESLGEKICLVLEGPPRLQKVWIKLFFCCLGRKGDGKL